MDSEQTILDRRGKRIQIFLVSATEGRIFVTFLQVIKFTILDTQNGRKINKGKKNMDLFFFQ